VSTRGRISRERVTRG